MNTFHYIVHKLRFVYIEKYLYIPPHKTLFHLYTGLISII